MKKAQWKQKPYERSTLTAQERIEKLEEMLTQVMAERDQAKQLNSELIEDRDELRKYAYKYQALRKKELVVMDGEAKYLTEDTLDAYCDELVDSSWWSTIPPLNSVKREWLQAINHAFNQEYAKWLQPQKQK